MKRRSTSADVARAAGVSRSTVSFVLNETPGQTISADVRTRVIREAARLKYTPDANARALARGSNRIVLVPLPGWPVEYALRQILDEAASALDAAGHILVTSTRRPRSTARPLWETLQPDVVLPIEPLSKDETSAIRRLGIRIAGGWPEASVRISAVDAQISHLLAAGHRSLAYASTAVDAFAPMNDARLSIARRVCAQAGASLLDATIDDRTVGEVLARWREDSVTAVAAFNDDTAAAVVGEAVRSGLRVPDDIAVIGHDDAPIARMLIPSLTTVRFDLTGLGRQLASIALASGEEQPPAMTGAEIIRRESA